MTQEIDFNPEERILCPNENCIGLLAETGICTICQQSFSTDQVIHKNKVSEEVVFGINEPFPSQETKTLVDTSSLEERQLCNDENCIGLVENKRCKVCGTVQ